MKGRLLPIAAGAIILGAASAANAVPVSFTNITNNGAPDAASQLLLDVTDGGTGALFDFGVQAGPNPGATIAEIYFDDGALFLPPPQIVTQVGVSYEVGDNSPPELPGANNATPDFDTSAGLEAENDGNNATGIQIGDDLVLRLVYLAGVDFGDVLAALADGSLRIGLHVRSLNCAGVQGPCEDSDSFVSNPPTVIPLPAALPLFLTALGGLGLLGWRRRTYATA